jgi:4-hydroxy-4-methyl-2-oxoglutarate aldolase
VNEFFEHEAVIPPRLVRGVPRLESLWFERFAAVRTPDIAEQVGLLYTMDSGIRPLYEPTPRLVGQALTVKPWPGDGLAMFGAAELAQPGDVIVVGGRGQLDVSRGGFHLLAVPRKRGLRGVVIDGAIRDAIELQEVDFPVFARAGTPHPSTKRKPGEINVPVACGGVIVEPGDLVVADGEGVVVVPRRHVNLVWEAVHAKQNLATDPEAQESNHSKRWENYRRAFQSAGGVEEAWDGSGARMSEVPTSARGAGEIGSESNEEDQ